MVIGSVAFGAATAAIVASVQGLSRRRLRRSAAAASLHEESGRHKTRWSRLFSCRLPPTAEEPPLAFGRPDSV